MLIRSLTDDKKTEHEQAEDYMDSSKQQTDDSSLESRSPDQEINNESSSSVFRNRFGHLRAGWRMLIYVALTAICFIPVLIVVGMFVDLNQANREMDFAGFGAIIGNAAMNLGLIVPAFVTLRWIDRRSSKMLGIHLSAGWLREFAVGIGFGFGLFTLVFLILWLSGLLDVSFNSINSVLIESLVKFVILFTLAGVLEEVLMRGYLFQALIEGSRTWIAIVVFSLVFSVTHYFNPNFSWMGALNIFLAGVLLSVAYVKTRSLWMPIGLHMAWNWTQGPLWGMNVSGIEIANSLVTSVPKGNELLSGGSFGGEGSLVSAVLIIGLSMYIWKAKWITPSDINAELWKKYPSGFGKDVEL